MFGLFNQQPPARLINKSRSGNRQSEPQVEQQSQPQSTTDRAAAMRRYKEAKAAYEQTRSRDSWNYLQRCIDDLEDAR